MPADKPNPPPPATKIDSEEGKEPTKRRPDQNTTAPKQINHVKQWLVVAILLAVGAFINHLIEEHALFLGVRFWYYRYAQESYAYQDAPPGIVLVLIDDAEYQTTTLGGAGPIKRDYVAKLIDALMKYHPRVVGLDFRYKTKNPAWKSTVNTPYGPVELAETEERAPQTAQLCSVIRRHSEESGCRFVLPRELETPEENQYVNSPHVYDHFPFESSKVHQGFINFAPDIRFIPRIVTTEEGKTFDSMALGLVRAWDPHRFDDLKWNKADSMAYFLPRGEITTIPARTVLNSVNTGSELLEDSLQGKIVLIGGEIHDNGKLVDGHSTPVDEMAGIFVHANYVQSILVGRYFKTGGAVTLLTWELAFGIALAYVLIYEHHWRKALFASLIIFSPLLFGWLVVHNFGYFFDTCTITILLLAKTFIEHYREKGQEHATS